MDRADPVTASTEPLILGIDPGLRICGWGIVRGGARAGYIASGAIKPKTTAPFAQRLLTIHDAIRDIILAHHPDEMAIEDPFVGAIQPASALAIGQARAAAIIAAATYGIEVELYAPAAVKAAVSGYGQGNKRQVQAMVRLLLGLAEPPEPLDAADALAVAICHLGNRRARALERASKR